jgi:hypothetical protein
MRRPQITFFVAGLIAGLICVALVFLGPPEVAIMTLMIGVGPLFFVAVVAGIVISGAWRHFRPGFLRYFAGLVICATSYLATAIIFWWVAGLSSKWLGFRSSDSLGHFGFDIWLGLIAAGALGAGCIAMFTTLLTGRWSNALLRRLMLAGLITLVVTFVANRPFQTDWSFLGLLFPVGNALFSYLVGSHILQHGTAETKVTAATPQPHHRPA